MTSTPKQPPSRVAVIAIHGVADQTPNETARMVAQLLSKRRDQATDNPCYTAWDERTLELAVAPVKVSEPNYPSLPSGQPEATPSRSVFDERNDYVKAYHQQQRGVTEADPPIDHGVMREQLRTYDSQAGEATYRSVRLVGTRHTQAPEVHIFEMYWADLSRLGTALTQIFGELYQLLFHVGSLARQTVDLARLEPDHAGSRSWRALCWSVMGAVRMLTLPIPILNLCVLPILLSVLPLTLEANLLPVVTLGLLGSAIGYLVSRHVVFPRVSSMKFGAWLVIGLLWVALVAYLAVSHFLAYWPTWPYTKLLIIEWYIATGFGLYLLIQRFDHRRPGANLIFYLVGGVISVLLLIRILLAEDSAAGLVGAGLLIVELMHIVVLVCWSGFYLLQVVAAGCSLGVLLRARRTGHRSQTLRVVQTVLLGLALPAIAILMVTLLTIVAVSRIASEIISEDLMYQARILSPASNTVKDFLNELQQVTATSGLAGLIVIMGIALILALYALAPVVFAEVRPPQKDDAAARSNQFGTWLTYALRLLWVASGLLVVTIVFVFPLISLSEVFILVGRQPPPLLSNVTGQVAQATPAVIQAMGTLFAVTTAGLVISGLRFGVLQNYWQTLSNLSLGFRPVIDVLLDVDNYLREHPKDGTPRAQICARYVSLLRHIAQWTDPDDGGPYTALVIVSHSQGTVITADLLRFLRHENQEDSALSRYYTQPTPDLPIYLLTLGSPLRQLYGLRFPHLYGWAWHSSAACENGGSHIPQNTPPDPGALGLRQWINAYRSGDYIGRYLWHADCCTSPWSHQALQKQGAAWSASLDALVEPARDTTSERVEFCIGPGAHTHYLDATAPEIAAVIDQLILCSAASRRV